MFNLSVYTAEILKDNEWVKVKLNEVQDGDLFRVYRNGQLCTIDGKTENIMKSYAKH